MNALRLLAGTIVAISIAAPLGMCQILVSPPLVDAPSDHGCPTANTTAPSAPATRCQALSQTSVLLDSGNHVFATLGAMVGYDSAFDSKKGLNAPFDGGVVYAGFSSGKSKSFDLFENTASGLDYHTDQRTFQYLDSATASLTRQPSSRNILGIYVNNIFGNDAIRVVELGGPSVNAEIPSYGIHTGKVLDNQATVRWTHQSTETRWFSASIRNTFRDFFDDNTQVNTLHASAQVQYEPSPRAGIGVFEETSIERGVVDCAFQSVGVVYERRLSRTLAFEGSAAPAIGTKGCVETLSANLYGALSAQPRRSTNLWVSAFRRLNDSQFASLTYENNVQGGWIQRFGLHDWLKAQGGWIGGTVPSQTPPFHGEYLSAAFVRRMGGGFTASLSAQHFNWSGVTSISPTRTFLTGGIYWSPNLEESAQVHGPMAH